MDTVTLDKPVIISQEPDTAEGQLTSPQLQEKAELKYSRSPIKIGQYDLIRWWDQGIVNTAHFIRLALMIERVGEDEPEDFNVEKFCGDWVGTKKNGEPRCVSPKQVFAEIQNLQQAGAAHVQTTVQMSLDVWGSYE